MRCPQCGNVMRDIIGQVRWKCEYGCTVHINNPDQKITPMTDTEILERTINDNGPAYETIVAMEEMSELTKELTKDWRDMGNLEHIAEEMADVEICLEMLKMIYGNETEVKEWKARKLKKLEEALYAE